MRYQLVLQFRGDSRVDYDSLIELEDMIQTGRHFHRFVHPDRDIEPEAEKVHGISIAFLHDKPRFHESHVCDEFLEFIGDAPLIAHNAKFDRGFVDHELKLAKRPITVEDRWIDTLGLAQKKFPGMYNSLDALCKRFKISLEGREKHGALVDSHLLAAVYLELRGGRERGLDLTPQVLGAAVTVAMQASYGARPRPLAPRSTDAEREAHVAFVKTFLKDKAVWLQHGLD